METSKFIDCPCKESNACYQQELEDGNTTWTCFGCGCTSNTLMKKDGPLHRQTLQTVPELYKDLSFVDDDNNVWFPATITIPGQGMVTVDGTDKENWTWMAVKAVRIGEQEKSKFPPDQEYKMDYVNAKHFGQKGFIDALEEVGFFEIKFE